MSWSLFRTYLSANVQSDKLEHIAFEALVYDKNQYHIVIDRHNLFGEIFKKIIAGTYARECIDKGLLNEWHEKCQTDANFNISMDEYAKKLFKINGNNPVKNLKEYIKWKNSDSVMTVLRDDGEYYYYKYVFENIAQQIETYSNDQTN
ncbi:MAG: hypothetical protein LBV04_02455, partial [Deferribacteraceae bacterium]|nr:hypothetical protein [Deferribacteraceae bacterium]